MEKIELPIELTEEEKVTPTRPAIKWLGKMLGFILIVLVILGISVYAFSYFILQKIDIQTEKKYFGELMISPDDRKFDMGIFENPKVEEAFQDYDIYISNDRSQNAFAGLGATITVTKGLLEQVESKEELLFIMGHEKTHIENRDVITGLSREIPITLTLGFLGLNFGNSTISTNSLFSSYISRDKEYKADKGGIELLNSLEMNTKCATNFFKRVGTDFEKYIEFISTHPESKKRLEIIESASLFPEKECEAFKWQDTNLKTQSS